jgi:peptide/nickel transport system permease protein
VQIDRVSEPADGHSFGSLVLRRLASAVILFWLVVSLTFVLLHLAPGDAAALLTPPDASAEDAARLRASLGLDEPAPVQYARWIGGVLRGDLGTSLAQQRPVRTMLAEALPVSFWLGASSLLLTFAIGVPLGLAQAVRRGRPLDHVLTVLTTAIYAAPTFWIALALVAVFTYGASSWDFPVALRLPAFGIRSPAGDLHGLAGVVDVIRHSILPVGILAAVGAAGIARYARSSVADVLDQDFVRTARAKGLHRRSVYMRHVLRNILPPLAVLFALSLPGVVAGSVFVESVFAWPGTGRMLLTAIAARDFPVVMGATLVYAALVILANLAAELALPLLDPRRRSEIV